MIKRGLAATILTIVVLSACGRREQPAAFDASSPKEAPPTFIAKPLPDSALHVRWSPAKVPAQLTAGALVPIEVTFTNTGDTTWPDPATADPKASSGAGAVRLGYSFLFTGRPGASPQRADSDRSDLIKPLAPGESATLKINVQVPKQPGDYRLSFELVQELVVWFTDRGADTLTVPVQVVAPGAAVAKSTP
jgi:hypothetical protein